jgi:hypothetical protein
MGHDYSNSSKFDNRDNPADIYLQLVKKHHCPKSTDGIGQGGFIKVNDRNKN